MYTKNFTLLNTGLASASDNMGRDAELLAGLDPKGAPILHLYDWERPAATYGIFIEPSYHLKGTEIDAARRSTGGGDRIPPLGSGFLFSDAGKPPRLLDQHSGQLPLRQ